MLRRSGECFTNAQAKAKPHYHKGIETIMYMLKGMYGLSWRKVGEPNRSETRRANLYSR